MAAGGTADAQARFGHSVKGLLTEKVTSCGTDVIALTKQVLKGSRSAEVSGGCRRVADYRAGAELGAGRAAPMHAGSCSSRGGDTFSCLGRDRDSGTGMRSTILLRCHRRVTARVAAGSCASGFPDGWLSRQRGDPRTVSP